MKRYRQTIDEILSRLSTADTAWRDAHAEAVILLLEKVPKKSVYLREDLVKLLQSDTFSLPEVWPVNWG